MPAKPVFLIDTQEPNPFAFPGMLDWSGLPVGPDRIRRASLPVGNYSLDGHTDRVAIRRKCFDGIFAGLSFGRETMLAEIDRAKSLTYFALLIEAPFDLVANGHPRYAKFRGSDAARTVLSWQVRYPWVHWIFCTNRNQGALVCLRLLERFGMVHPN